MRKTLVQILLLALAISLPEGLRATASLSLVSGAACPNPGSPSPDGSIITPDNPLCSLHDWEHNVWKFTGSRSSDGANYTLTVNGACCAVGRQAETVEGGQLYWQQAFPTCGTVWRHHEYHANRWASSPGVELTGYFTDMTTNSPYASMAQALSQMGDNRTLSVSRPPAGYECWPDAVGVALNNLTIKVAPGVKFADVQTSKGILVLDGNNISVVGGEFVGAIRISTNALNPTLQNMTIHDGCGLIGTSCILSGGSNGTVKIADVTVYGGGDSADYGQDHNVYVSADPRGDRTTVSVSQLVSYNVTNGGWTLKLRPVSGTVANSIIGCTKSGGECEQNGTVDMPCGGDYTISNSTLERGPGGDNWFVVRTLEELPSADCASGGYDSNHVTLDNVIVIWDGPAPGNPGYIPILCGGGSTCSSPIVKNAALCVKNSKIVSDPRAPFRLSLGPNVTDCGIGGNSNKFYASREAAGAALNWPSSDQFGYPCCAFPYLPPHPS